MALVCERIRASFLAELRSVPFQDRVFRVHRRCHASNRLRKRVCATQQATHDATLVFPRLREYMDVCATPGAYLHAGHSSDQFATRVFVHGRSTPLFDFVRVRLVHAVLLLFVPKAEHSKNAQLQFDIQ